MTDKEGIFRISVAAGLVMFVATVFGCTAIKVNKQQEVLTVRCPDGFSFELKGGRSHVKLNSFSEMCKERE